MKVLTTRIVMLSSLVLTLVFLTGCLKDKTTRTFSIYTPVYKTTEEVRANIKSNSPQSIANAGKLFIRGKYIFLNEIDKGIHIIDNSNPSSPINSAFISIPGNMDLAVKGNILYADLYTDLVTIDITNPLDAKLKNVIPNAFPFRRYSNGFTANNQMIITDWIKRDTTVVVDESGGWQGCNQCFLAMESFSSADASGKAASPFGVGGSMARFSIVNSHLYTVSDADLNVYSIATPEKPIFSNKSAMGWGIETIYPFKNRLFIGSTTGMFIFDIIDPDKPSRLGQFSHLTACDPVIADDNNAFVTLSSGVRCRNSANQLDVLNISNLSAPTLVKSYPLTNPQGLSKDGNTLFVCDGKDGLKIFDASAVNDLKLLGNIKGFDSYDVIAQNKLAIVVAKDGIRQYDYSNVNDLKLLSRIGWQQ